MAKEFREFFERYKEIWKSSSINELKEMISKDYQAREITGNDIVDFGYEESISGWEQAFTYFKNQSSEWVLSEISTIPLKEDEVMVILAASLIIEGKQLETSNLFFQTFKKEDNSNWHLVRSYIEAGVRTEKLNKLSFSWAN
ncbi:flavoprotein [Neobacillus sp. D3-1R]|uniref:flavoprotein n=1 Tax=Neobacillus sp. D3-1R TaxID=3445778 RepID=UPI003F9F436C